MLSLLARIALQMMILEVVFISSTVNSAMFVMLMKHYVISNLESLNTQTTVKTLRSLNIYVILDIALILPT